MIFKKKKIEVVLLISERAYFKTVKLLGIKNAIT